MLNQAKLFLSAFILIPLIDFGWIGLLMKPFYMEELGDHRRMVGGQFKPQLLPAVLVYVILAIGILAFILSWVESWKQALGYGALLGLLCYGTYDLTNLSTLRDYSWKLGLTDMAWGTTLCAIVSLITFFERNWLNS